MGIHVLAWAFFGYAPLALLVCAPACAILARHRNRDSETWYQLGAVGGPVALAWILLLGGSSRPNDADAALAHRTRTPSNRIPAGPGASSHRCLLCAQVLEVEHRCSPEVVEDRIQRRWTVRVGGQRILGPPF